MLSISLLGLRHHAPHAVIFKVKRDLAPQLYHSINRCSNDVVQFSIPREDYTVNREVARANWMITKLCKEFRHVLARQVFDEMNERDVITWTALISGYVKCGMIGDARALFDRVDALKNVATWTAMMSGYLKTGQIFEAEKLFDEMPEKNAVAWNTMIDGYMKMGRIEQALDSFDKMEGKGIVSWHMVMSGLIKAGRVEEARVYFDRMPVRNVISWTIMMSGLASSGAIDEARMLFDRMPERNVVTWNAMISGYMQNMRLHEAFDLFEMMPEKSVQSWNAMITGLIQNGELVMARRLFDAMPQKNVVTWTAMINGLTRDSQSEEALKLFCTMKRDRMVTPNLGTFVSVLGACSNLAGLSMGMQIHQVIYRSVPLESEFVISALISMYSKCGELAMARKTFDNGSRSCRDLASWNSLIAAYAHHGLGHDAIDTFNEMQVAGLKPNEVTYVGLLYACNHSGLVQEGLNYYKALLRDKSIQPREEHYTLVIDLYSRAGRLSEALDMLDRLPLRTSAFAWGSVLLGCNMHGNADVGRLVADRLLRMDMLMSNMHGVTEKWRDAETTKRKIKKQPGCSWIEVGNEFHVFVAGAESHDEIEAIHLLVRMLHVEMKVCCASYI